MPSFMPQNKKPRQINIYMYLVETVGIEPTSRDIATQVSTRLVDILSFAYSTAYRQAFEQLVWFISTIILRR